MADRIIQTDTLQGIANALRGGASQSAADKIEVADFAEVAQVLKSASDSLVALIGREETSFTIPEGITSIGVAAFKDYTNLEEVDLPSTLLTIAREAFQGCTKLESITIPEGVTTIGSEVFRDCKALAEINLPSTITTLGDFLGTNVFEGINANAVINCAFSEGAVSGAPWSAPNTVTINYDVTE